MQRPCPVPPDRLRIVRRPGARANAVVPQRHVRNGNAAKPLHDLARRQIVGSAPLGHPAIQIPGPVFGPGTGCREIHLNRLARGQRDLPQVIVKSALIVIQARDIILGEAVQDNPVCGVPCGLGNHRKRPLGHRHDSMIRQAVFGDVERSRGPAQYNLKQRNMAQRAIKEQVFHVFTASDARPVPSRNRPHSHRSATSPRSARSTSAAPIPIRSRIWPQAPRTRRRNGFSSRCGPFRCTTE
mmetsp:Transcript_28837/g.54847  ORF Transcript_28837/g.54847 Transcript_28837/m.54847 type:complete len:241 (+) Transcript_28837:3458-4180(+)